MARRRPTTSGGSESSLASPSSLLLILAAAMVILGGRDPAVSDTARVQVVVDLSEKMFCPQVLQTGERCTRALIDKEAEFPEVNRRPTRIGQAQNFAMDGIAALDQPDDELGISTFYSTSGHAVFGTKLPIGKVKDVSSDPTVARVLIRQAFATLKGADGGGSPLRDAIDGAVDALRQDAPAGGSVTNTVVVLTDGNDNGSMISADALRQKLSDLGQAKPVRVLVTAANDAACQPLLPIVEASDGDCFAAPTKDSLTCAKDNILAALRRPHPKEPRTRAEIVEDREDC